MYCDTKKKYKKKKPQLTPQKFTMNQSEEENFPGIFNLMSQSLIYCNPAPMTCFLLDEEKRHCCTIFNGNKRMFTGQS